jgi:ketopantoate reductase
MSQILIIGQGNIGTFLGMALKNTGHTVRHYVRNPAGKASQVMAQFNDRRKRAKIKKGSVYQYQRITDLTELQNYDYVLVSVAHYHLRKVVQDLKPYLTEKQSLVIAGNIWQDFDWLTTALKTPYFIAFPNFGGAIVEGKLTGWLTPKLTTGLTDNRYVSHLQAFEQLLQEADFKPSRQSDIASWLKTHFAYNAGMLLEAARQDGFQNMRGNWQSIRNMYRLIREFMGLAQKLGTPVQEFPEGKLAFQPIWWNTFKTFLIFLLPGIAKSADANKDLEDWESYANTMQKDSH